MIVLITTGIVISFAFRYILCWEGTRYNYIQFLGLWLMLVGLVFSNGLPHASITDISNQLDTKCPESTMACILGARIAMANGDDQKALALLEGVTTPESDRIRFIIRLKALDESVMFEVVNFLEDYPKDIELRESYAGYLANQGHDTSSMTQYQLLKSHFQELGIDTKLVDVKIYQLELRMPK